MDISRQICAQPTGETHPTPFPFEVVVGGRTSESTMLLGDLIVTSTLQRQNTEISKHLFSEKEYRGLSPNFHIYASVSDLHIPTIGLPILLEEICRPILGLYKSLTGT